MSVDSPNSAAPAVERAPAPRPRSSGHLEKLDVLRALAILGVFCFHFLSAVNGVDALPWKDRVWRDFSANQPALLRWGYPLSLGWSGVALFFVLSGFLIHLTSVKAADSGRLSVKGFYQRRFWRIYPPYFMALIVIVAFQLVVTRRPAGSLQFVMHLFLVHNLYSVTIFGINPAFWSLGTEMQFYLLYPLLLLFRRRWGMTGALILTLVVGVASRACITALYTRTYGFVPAMADTAFATVTWFEWAVGAWLAERYYSGEPALPLKRWHVVLMGMAFVGITLFRPLVIFQFTAASLFFACVLDRYVRSEAPLSRIERAVIPVGLCSYSFYLFHQPVLRQIVGKAHGFSGPGAPPWKTAVLFGGSFVLILGFSWVVYSTVETWSMRKSKQVTITA
jgi:peptidoglycan/LPS O-acetylase OafA/YrhL